MNKCEITMKSMIDGVETIQKYEGVAYCAVVEEENKSQYNTSILTSDTYQSYRLMSAAIFAVVEKYMIEGISEEDIGRYIYLATDKAIENAVKSVALKNGNMLKQ